MFTGEHFDPEDWAELFQRAGARFAGPVAIHHDGFAMWDSDLNPWNAGAMGPKRDMKKIATFHHARNLQRNAADTANWEGGSSHYPYHPDYATSSTDPKLRMLYGNMPAEEFNDYWLGQITEVVDKYSPEIIWFDSWLTDITLSYSSWCYIQDQTYKDAALLLRNMIDVWSKKGVVLLNVSPKADGTIPDEQRKVLAEMGEWLDTYGEAVYNTRTHSIYGYGVASIEDGNHGGQKATIQYSADDIRFTASKDGKALYVFCLGSPEPGEVLQIQHVHNPADPVSSIKNVTVLGTNTPVIWEYIYSVLEIKAPEAEQMNEIATIFKVEFE